MSAFSPIYFLSDFHLGIPTPQESIEREKKIVAFLQRISTHCGGIYLLGDIFDFWFEYKWVVPRGFTRLLGQLATITDKGIPIYYFAGNHDLWLLNYLAEECGIQISKASYHLITIAQKKFLIGHGDGLGKGQRGYKIMKKIFQNPLAQSLFSTCIHPNLAIQIGLYFSRKSYLRQVRKYKGIHIFKGKEKEPLIGFCEEKLKEEAIDYFVFGHRHLPLLLPLNVGDKQAIFCNTGDWIQHFSYLQFDGTKMHLCFYE